MPSAPLGVSSQSRKKLKTFVFDEQLLTADHDKENPRTETHLTIVEQASIACNQTDEPPPPKTPLNRAVQIPIEDLIANAEDAYNAAPPQATPIDHVLWAAHPGSSGLSASAAHTQPSRKRAHSSSPASSQQTSAQKEPLNLDTLNRSLRTPNHDPTQELWNRYTTANGNKKDTTEQVVARYAHLIPSSPQTPSTTSRDSSLRRTHSCGVEWPTSKKKRRKLEEQHSRTKELFAASRKDILRRDLSNNTRVGLLLEKIQESLSKKPDAPGSPSSSSPLPDRRSQADVSPTKLPVGPDGGGIGLQPSSRSPGKSSTLKSTSRDASFSSEFSDDLLDMETLEQVEHIIAETEVNSNNLTALRSTSQPYAAQSRAFQPHLSAKSGQMDGPGDQTSSGNLGQLQETVAAEDPIMVDSDDFDDDDDDEELMKEMVDLAAQYDSQRSTIKKRQQSPIGAPTEADKQPHRLETLDEFEDAFDDDDDDMWQEIAKGTPKAGTPVGSKNVRLV
jgi:DNA replication ATP-dependent helicase Dna2